MDMMKQKAIEELRILFRMRESAYTYCRGYNIKQSREKAYTSCCEFAVRIGILTWGDIEEYIEKSNQKNEEGA